MAKVHKRVVPAIVCNPSMGGGGVDGGVDSLQQKQKARLSATSAAFLEIQKGCLVPGSHASELNPYLLLHHILPFDL